jgi:hypothetical protein
MTTSSIGAFRGHWQVAADRRKVVEDEEDHCASEDVSRMYIPMISRYRLMSALSSGTASNV